MINGTPKVEPFAVDLHEHLVQVPPLLWPGTQPLGSLPSDFGGENRAKPMPLETHGVMTDIDAAFVQQVLDISQREREADV